MVGADQIVDGLRRTHRAQRVGQIGSGMAAKAAHQFLWNVVPDVHGVGKGAVQIKNGCLGKKVGHRSASKNKITPGISRERQSRGVRIP